MELFAVAGNPVLHSKSPRMFNALFCHLSMDAVYCRLAAFDGQDILATARAVGMRGLNITAPFKEEIIQYLNRIDATAKAIGAVNTVVRIDGNWIGYNTDHLGVLGAFASTGIDLKGKRAAVIGAGGAARAAVFGLISAGARTTVINRTFQNAKRLARDLGADAVPFEEIGRAIKGCDILLSAIASRERIVDPALLSQNLTVLDANYGAESPLMADARERGCTVIPGSQWLLFQAAAAFPLFTGVTAPVDVMGEALIRSSHTFASSLALIGFMGAGKSAVAAIMEETYGTTTVHIDREIERTTGSSVAEIFETLGEGAFRELEKQAIRRLTGGRDMVVSCGGGTVLEPANVRRLKERAQTIWLWVNPDTALARLAGEPERPLLPKAGAQQMEARRILEARMPFYARAADMIVNTEGRTVHEIVQRIYRESHRTVGH